MPQLISDDFRDMGEQRPLARVGQSEEIAATVSWLISPEASYVTGSDIA
jgi:NAD(P)-dependent dehydrogenase (short-subunit alcohol dehydrogenase family)